MLGTHLDEPHGVEGGGSTPMLGLLPLSTSMSAVKRTERVAVDFEHRSGRRRSYEGYEIRHGEVSADVGDAGTRAGGEPAGDGLVVAHSAHGAVAWRRDTVLATTVHGLFEDPAFVREVVGVETRDVLDETFTLLADAVEEHADTALLRAMTGSER